MSESRIYTIVYRAADGSGNASAVSTTVMVPHDLGRVRSAVCPSKGLME
ncbi:MAG: hypothetical protein ACREAA_00070 [Candidatus Polarisedimenticolia bacterium]